MMFFFIKINRKSLKNLRKNQVLAYIKSIEIAK